MNMNELIAFSSLELDGLTSEWFSLYCWNLVPKSVLKLYWSYLCVL